MSDPTVKVTLNPVVEALKAAQPQVQTAQQTQSSTSTASPQPLPTAAASPDFAKLLQEVLDLKKKVVAGEVKAAQKIVDAAPPAIDWTKITEKDIIDLSVDIPVIEQATPEYMNVHLLDKNYIPRWVHVMSQRLNVCLSQGYAFVKKEDFDTRFPIILNFDTSGNYSCGDVVCLKVLKSRYYPAIKANYMKTMAIHGRAKLDAAIAKGKTGVQLDRKGNPIQTSETEPEVIDPRRINFYHPGDEQQPGEKEWTKEMVS